MADREVGSEYLELHNDMVVDEICKPGDTDRAESVFFMRFEIV